MKEYIITRAIPIPELLCAFDIYLVRSSYESVDLFNPYNQCEELQMKKPKTLVYFVQVVLSGE
jgi:hypothetical protein